MCNGQQNATTTGIWSHKSEWVEYVPSEQLSVFCVYMCIHCVDSAFYPLWDGKMSSNSFAWVTEGGDLGTADWGCLAGRCASLCLQAAHGGRAAGGSG